MKVKVDTHTDIYDVYAQIRAERARQDGQWGGATADDRHSALEWIAIVTKHVGKAADYALDAETSAVSGPHPLAQGYRRAIRRRLVSIAAVCVAAIEAIDRAMSAAESEATR